MAREGENGRDLCQSGSPVSICITYLRNQETGIYWQPPRRQPGAFLISIENLKRILRTAFCLAALMICGTIRVISGQFNDHTLPHIVQKDGRCELFVDGAPYLMLGAQWMKRTPERCLRMCAEAIAYTNQKRPITMEYDG